MTMPERVALMCKKCTYVYRASLRPGIYEIGAIDRACRSSKNPGKLIAAPDDAMPGTYYDDSKDPRINCITSGFIADHPEWVRENAPEMLR